MNESENFLARWLRLKRQTALAASANSKNGSREAPQPVDDHPTPPFDPKSLPSIESIDAATDIRPFLEARVPEELTRAALRSTWSADPAIRDFIGIAENQWDFNDPASIPGFGLLTAADCLSNLVVQGVESLEGTTGIGSEKSRTIDPLNSEPICPASSDPTDVAHKITVQTANPSLNAAAYAPAVETHVSDQLVRPNASEGDSRPGVMRSHGGALPE